ncbi:MAG: hypothetical protein ACE363_12770 [Alphaproteobacteria bacterium]
MFKAISLLVISAVIFVAGSAAASAVCTYHIKLYNDNDGNITIAKIGTKKTTGDAHKTGNISDFVVPENGAAMATFGRVARLKNTAVYFGVRKKDGTWFWSSEKASCHDSYVRSQDGNPIKIFLK